MASASGIRAPLVLSSLVMLLVAVIGLEHVAFPFYGDQALFVIGAQKMSHGAVLYRDFWDLKQPAIYVAFLLGGSIFGFNATGIHLFELLYLLTFSIVLIATTRDYFRWPVTSVLVPLFTVGVYYANASGAFGMTQVEALVGFPLYLASYFVLEGARRNKHSLYFIGGLAGAAVLAFKLIFLPIVVAIWAVAIWRSNGWRSVSVLTIGLVIGSAAWLVPMCIAAGPGIVYETFIAAPAWIAHTLPHAPMQRLVGSFAGYATGALPLMLLALFAPLRDFSIVRKPLWAASAVWIATGVLVILMQHQSWWSYQVQLLIVPVGILAAYGVESLRGHITEAAPRARRWKIASATAILLVASSGLTGHVFTVTRALVHARLAIAPADAQRFQAAIDPLDAKRYEAGTFIRNANPAGKLYVFGSPVYYLGAGRTQPVAINGWSADLLTPAEWTRLFTELESAMPDYVFVANDYRMHVSRSVVGSLLHRYRAIQIQPDGAWLKRSNVTFGEGLQSSPSTSMLRRSLRARSMIMALRGGLPISH